MASNAVSLAEAYADRALHPLGIYDAKAHFQKDPRMVGFTMYEVSGGVGYIMRLMIDAKYQRLGYGTAAMVEVIRRLKLNPDVEIIATSHRSTNSVAAKLYESLGFVDWEHEEAVANTHERYLILQERLP